MNPTRWAINEWTFLAPVRLIRGSAKIRAKAATGHNRALQDPFDLDSPQISNLLYITQSFLLPRLR